MKKYTFCPQEILFSSTTRCNLKCAHCDIKKYPGALSIMAAKRFISACANKGIKRVGFTGGEPFLETPFLLTMTKEAIRQGMSFSRIMTNASWFRAKKDLVTALTRLFSAGYDSSFCISVDAFHRQRLDKVAVFINTATAIWKRPDVVSLACVMGAQEKKTRARLKKLSYLLNARLMRINKKYSVIRNASLFIRIQTIALSPIGKADKLKDPWDGKWFRDDLCKGPGHVFFILPNGNVKPCCGYANDSDLLTIGSIKKDLPARLIRNAQKNLFVKKIFSTGMHSIRKKLRALGVLFPGKTTNHCFFCHYLLSHVPRTSLQKALEGT